MANGARKYKISIKLYEMAGQIVFVHLWHVKFRNFLKIFPMSHRNKDYLNIDLSLE